jgi:hypothetical protein
VFGTTKEDPEGVLDPPIVDVGLVGELPIAAEDSGVVEASMPQIPTILELLESLLMVSVT